MPSHHTSKTAAREMKKATVNIRLSANLKEAAEKAAEDDSRTLPSLIVKLLKDHLAANGYFDRNEGREK